MKSILLKLSIALISLFLALTLKTPATKAQINCSISKDVITSGQGATITFHWPGKQSDTFTLKVQGPINITRANLSPDSGGNIIQSVSPLNEPGTYRYEFFEQSDPSSAYCSSTFTVITTSGSQGCPEFSRYSSNDVSKGKSVTAFFTPVTGTDQLRTNPSSYYVQVNQKTSTRLSPDWQAEIVPEEKGPIRLFFAPNTAPAPTPQQCYDLPTTIKISKSSGENPCKDFDGDGKIECKTAFGDISTDPGAFVTRILAVAIGLAGGIALIFMVIGSIKVLTSSGDQQKLTGGKDMIVAAVSGLLFLILSVLILRFIGNNLLGGIPGF